MNLGKAIKELRKKRNCNQMTFAKQIGVSQGYLSQIEKGTKKPSVDLLESMSEKLDIPLPMMFWFSISENDVVPEKVKIYRILKPVVDNLIYSFFN